jgi:hypothetical protein
MTQQKIPPRKLIPARIGLKSRQLRLLKEFRKGLEANRRRQADEIPPVDEKIAKVEAEIEELKTILTQEA